MMSRTQTRTTVFTAEDPDIPSPAEGEYEVIEVIAVTGEPPLVEEGQVAPPGASSTYRRKKRTAEAQPPDGLPFWPVYVDRDGNPVDPDVVYQAILDGAELDADAEQVNRILERLRRRALVPSDELKRYRRPLHATWARSKAAAVARLDAVSPAAPGELRRTLTTEQMAEIFGVAGTTIHRWVDVGRLPRPVVRGSRGHTSRWDLEQVRARLTGVPAAKAPTYDFEVEEAGK